MYVCMQYALKFAVTCTQYMCGKHLVLGRSWAGMAALPVCGYDVGSRNDHPSHFEGLQCGSFSSSN